MLEFISRRVFLQLAAVFAAQSRPAPAGAQPLQPDPSSRWTGAVLQANEGEHLVAGRRRAPMRIKVDSTKAVGATMSMVISEVSPGASIPIHLHRNEDELDLHPHRDRNRDAWRRPGALFRRRGAVRAEGHLAWNREHRVRSDSRGAPSGHRRDSNNSSGRRGFLPMLLARARPRLRLQRARASTAWSSRTRPDR